MRNQIFDVSLRQIQYFLSVAETGSITQAAERLYIAQPVLSKKMMALEEEIGLSLFDRDGRTVQLTQTGVYLYGRWKKLLEDYERDLTEAGRMQRFLMNRFSIGCFPVLNTGAFLYPFLEKLTDRFPELDIKVKRQNPALLLEDIQSRELDMAFIMETDMPEGQDFFEVKEVSRCPLVAAVHEENPLSGKETISYSDLDGQDLLFCLPEKSPQKHSGIHQLCVEHQVEAASVRYVNSDVTTVVQVSMGHGVTLGPKLFYPEYTPKVKLIPVRAESLRIMAVWDKRNIPEVKELICNLLR